MAVIFLGLSIDEGSSLQEMTMNPLRQLFHTVHFPYAAWFIHAWVVLGLAFVAIFAVAYLRFLQHLNETERLGFIRAGVVYVAGAIGMEILNGRYASEYGYDTLQYAMLTLVEETLEMTGIVLFIQTLLHYLESHIGRCGIKFGKQQRLPVAESAQSIGSDILSTHRTAHRP